MAEHMQRNISRRALLGGAGLLLVVQGLSACSAGSSAATSSSSNDQSSDASSDTSSSDASTQDANAHGTRQDAVLEAPLDNGYDSGKHHAEISVKDFGVITVELDAQSAPITVSNFAQLAEDGFYDGLTFHRIIKGFMVQGGDPNGDGTGGSDQKIKGEFAKNGVTNGILHKRGVISMARSQAANSASSQFFIMQEDTDSLNGSYAAFGHVTDDAGLAVVDALAEVPTEDSNGTVAAENQPQIDYIKMID
ncbi:MAG: peptidylprolyl isomerase [Atopobiaceae bacterium]|jgi:peptidyl-prolyl cis-trans isomerase B (cyclophilin B)